MKLQINYSSQLMDNFLQKQEEVISNKHQFEAFQTADGHSLLFSLGTDGKLYLIREISDNQDGWKKTDLSEQIAKQLFNNQTIVIKKFSARQNETTGKLSIAVAVSIDGKDSLVVSPKLSNTDSVFGQEISWQKIDFDDANSTIPKIVISDLFIGYSDKKNLLVVDVFKNPNDSRPLLFRYNVDIDDVVQKWHPHDVSIDLEAKKSINIIGRVNKKRQDGIFTVGQLGNDNTLIYHPIDTKSNVAPNPIRLSLEGGTNPENIAVTSLTNPIYTDLFAVGEGSLFYFGLDNQKDEAVGKRILTNEVFEGVKSLYASSNDKEVIIWGLNAKEEVFYTTCSIGEITNEKKWSFPLPIVADAQQIAPYLNRVNDSNTFFVHTGENELSKMEMSSKTDTWLSTPILLPAASTETLQIKSYTTQVTLKDEEGNLVPDHEVELTAPTRSSFYINNRYYVLDQGKTVKINTNHIGGISIVEAVKEITGATIIVKIDGNTVEIDPTKSTIEKIKQLDSVEKLKDAKVKDDQGNDKVSLISSNTTNDELESAVAAIKQLSKVKNDKTGTRPKALLYSQPTGKITRFRVNSSGTLTVEAVDGQFGGWGDVWAKVGDAVRWVKNKIKDGVEVVIDMVEEVGGAVKFIVRMAGKVINFIVDCVKAVGRVFVAIFEAIKTGLKKFWNYLKFIFNWGDIKRTKEFFKEMVKGMFTEMETGVEDAEKHVIAFIESIRQVLQGSINEVVQSGRVIKLEKQSPMVEAALKVVTSAPAQFLINHFFDSLAGIVKIFNFVMDLPTKVKNFVSGIENENPDSEIVNIIEDLKSIYQTLLKQLENREIDLPKMATLLGDLLNRIIDLIEKGVTEVFELLKGAVKGLFGIIDKPIEFPVLTHVLKKYCGVNSFSFLDVVCYIAAVPATIIYKSVTGKAPILKGSGKALPTSPETITIQESGVPTTQYIERTDTYFGRNARDFNDRVGCFTVIKIGEGILKMLHIWEVTTVVKKLAAKGVVESKISFANMVFKVVHKGLKFAANRYITIKHNNALDDVYKFKGYIKSGLEILLPCVKTGCKKYYIANNNDAKANGLNDIEKIFAYIKAGVAIPEIGISIAHFCYLGSNNAGTGTLTAGIIRGVQEIADSTQNIMKAVAMYTGPEPTALTVLSATYIVGGGAAIGEGITIAVMDKSQIKKATVTPTYQNSLLLE